MTQCCVCHRPRTPYKTVVLSEEEKIAFRKVGNTAPNTLTYCGPCWHMAVDKVQGPQLFRGLLQLRLQSNGLSPSRAEETAKAVEAEMVRQASVTKAPLS